MQFSGGKGEQGASFYAPAIDFENEVKIEFRSHRWNWFESFFFCITVVTTIGYGSRVPRSTCGKMAVIPYAGFGIVLVGFFISVLTKRLKVNVAKCAGWYRAHASVIVKCDCELEKWNRNIKRKTF